MRLDFSAVAGRGCLVLVIDVFLPGSSVVTYFSLIHACAGASEGSAWGYFSVSSQDFYFEIDSIFEYSEGSGICASAQQGLVSFSVLVKTSQEIAGVYEVVSVENGSYFSTNFFFCVACCSLWEGSDFLIVAFGWKDWHFLDFFGFLMGLCFLIVDAGVVEQVKSAVDFDWDFLVGVDRHSLTPVVVVEIQFVSDSVLEASHSWVEIVEVQGYMKFLDRFVLAIYSSYDFC